MIKSVYLVLYKDFYRISCSHKKNKFSILILLFFFILSCKTTPIIYDNTQKSLANEIEIITLLLNNNEIEKANKKLSILEKTNSKSSQIITLRVYLLLKEKKYKQAIELGTINSEKTNNPLLSTLLARAYYSVDDYVNSEKQMKIALNSNRLLPFTWYQKGLIEFDKKDYRSAELSFNRTHLLDKSYKDALFLRYICRIYLKRPIEEISNDWAIFSESNKLLAEHYIYHALALYENNYLEDALTIVNKGLSYFNDSYLLNLKAYILYEQSLVNGDKLILEEALNLIETALQKNILPEFADTHLVILNELNEKSIFDEVYNKYLLLFPGNETIIKWETKKSE